MMQLEVGSVMHLQMLCEILASFGAWQYVAECGDCGGKGGYGVMRLCKRARKCRRGIRNFGNMIVFPPLDIRAEMPFPS